MTVCLYAIDLAKIISPHVAQTQQNDNCDGKKLGRNVADKKDIQIADLADEKGVILFLVPRVCEALVFCFLLVLSFFFYQLGVRLRLADSVMFIRTLPR